MGRGAFVFEKQMKIALTGGIAEGKSTVLKMIADLGIPTLQADLIARSELERPEVQALVAPLFGLPLPLDRVKLRQEIADPRKRRQLNQILHPLVIAHYDRFESGVVEIPLLIETVGQGRFDQIWVATCGRTVQRQRLMERLGSEAETDRLLATQIDSRAKCAFADWIVRTDQEIGRVSKVVREQCRFWFPH